MLAFTTSTVINNRIVFEHSLKVIKQHSYKICVNTHVIYKVYIYIVTPKIYHETEAQVLLQASS
jgi:hypothetical protein